MAKLGHPGWRFDRPGQRDQGDDYDRGAVPNITINGLQLQNFDWIGVGVHGGSAAQQNFPVTVDTATGNIIENNIIENGYGGSGETSNVYGNGGSLETSAYQTRR